MLREVNFTFHTFVQTARRQVSCPHTDKLTHQRLSPVQMKRVEIRSVTDRCGEWELCRSRARADPQTSQVISIGQNKLGPVNNLGEANKQPHRLSYGILDEQV